MKNFLSSSFSFLSLTSSSFICSTPENSAIIFLVSSWWFWSCLMRLYWSPHNLLSTPEHHSSIASLTTPLMYSLWKEATPESWVELILLENLEAAILKNKRVNNKKKKGIVELKFWNSPYNTEDLLDMVWMFVLSISPLQTKIRKSCQYREEVFWLTPACIDDIWLHYANRFFFFRHFMD